MKQYQNGLKSRQWTFSHGQIFLNDKGDSNPKAMVVCGQANFCQFIILIANKCNAQLYLAILPYTPGQKCFPIWVLARSSASLFNLVSVQQHTTCIRAYMKLDAEELKNVKYGKSEVGSFLSKLVGAQRCIHIRNWKVSPKMESTS